MRAWVVAAAALAGGLIGAGGVHLAGRAGGDAVGGAVVRDYLLAHPEVIPEAMDRLQKREQARAVASTGDAVTRAYAGAFMGNPNGDVVLVEYYDYNCGICRANLPVVRELVRRDPNLKVVFRELPVLAPSSRDAARASLAAARRNRFPAFHNALFAAGRVTPDSIAAATRAAGVTVPAEDPAADAEIARNLETAGRLGVTGVPSWVVGDEVMIGAQPLERLQKAIADARAAG